MVIDLLGNIIDWTGIFLHLAFTRLKSTAISLIVLFGILAVLLWLSVFFYASFYWLYMPSASHSRPVHFKFEVCPDGIGICTFPKANLSFGEDGREQILHQGQSYRITLELELPESPSNRGIGMFMVLVQMYDKDGRVIQESARSAMLHYRSLLLRSIETVIFAPLYLVGMDEQKQMVDIELFSHYVDGVVSSAVGAVIQVHSKKIDIYSSKLKILADFSGLRYYLFYWPKLSAVCGMSSNFMFLAFVVLLSWLQYFRKEHFDEEEFVPMMRRMSLDMRRQRVMEQMQRDKDSESSQEEEEDETRVMTIMSEQHETTHDETPALTITEAATEEDDVIKSPDDTLLPPSDSHVRLRRLSSTPVDA